MSLRVGVGRDEAHHRLRVLLDAATRLADPSDPLGREARARLPSSTGLSPQGVAWALEHHLERSASTETLQSFFESVTPAARIWINLSANVFTAALRALGLALVAAPSVCLRPSRREPVFSQLLLRSLSETARGVRMCIELVPSIEARAGDHVHAYGHDETLAHMRSQIGPNIPLWPHGTGFGLAVVEQNDSIAQAAEQIAQDVIAFDQRGCLSPRTVLSVGTPERGRYMAQALSDHLLAWRDRVPSGPLDEQERAMRRRYLDTAILLGGLYGQEAAYVGLDPSPRSLWIPAGPRVVHVICVQTAAEALQLCRPFAAGIAALGGRGPITDSLAQAVPGARRSGIGQMQKPPLDGPVDRRVKAPSVVIAPMQK